MDNKLYLVILVLLNLFLYLQVKKTFNKALVRVKRKHDYEKDEYEKLYAENAQIKKDNLSLRNTLAETVAFYEITKEICKHLDEDKVFEVFKQQANKFLEFCDCYFLKGDADLSKYKDHIVFPLNINKGLLGYLVAEGIKEADRDKFFILAQQFLLGIKRAVLYQRVSELAITDPLCGILSRRYWTERFNEEIERSRKLKYNLSCLMIDADHFKDYNDRYGHLVGDVILREISRTIKENTREIDIVGRFGGEEFAVVLSETASDNAVFVAERIRTAVEQKNIRAYDENLQVTISIGIAGFPGDGKTLQSLIDKADHALYRAKNSGRNRVCLI